MTFKLKVARPGGETRVISFPSQPSWLDVQAKVASYFNIPQSAVAVSYEDSDGDVVTMSSQEELQDYFHSCYKIGQTGKLTVVDRSNSPRSVHKGKSTFVEDVADEVEEGIPTMGPTMFIEVGDGGWQRLPRIPEIFEIQEEDDHVNSNDHAFVEVVDSDGETPKKDDKEESPERTSNNDIAARQDRHKGKEKASLLSEATRSTSSASVINDNFPTKPSIHVYDVSNHGRSPRDASRGTVSLAFFPSSVLLTNLFLD